MRPPADPPVVSAAPLAKTESPAKYQLGTAKFESVNHPTAGPPAIDVQQMLMENVARANAAGLNELAPSPPRRSRRRRDYWLLMIGGNSLLGLIAALSGPSSPFVFVFALAGMALLSAGLSWVMWFVMDDY